MGRIHTIFGRFILVLVALIASVPARAAPPPIHPGPACVLVTETAESPYALLASPTAFSCADKDASKTGPITWGLLSGLNIASDPHDPWEVRHEYSQAQSETLFVRYADGRMAQAPSDRMTARRLFSPGMMSFALPADQGVITDILIRVEGLQNQRGVAPGLMLATGRAALDGDLVVLLLYGLLGGTIIALFAYNFALFINLRYPFVAAYCLSTVAMLFMGTCWSGGIFLAFPDMNSTTQISLTMLGTSLVLGTGSLFLMTFVERPYLPRWPMRFTGGAALIAIGSSIIRVIDPHRAWQLMDRLTYGAISVVLIGLLVTSALASLRGSRSARMYLAAWSIPIILGFVRTMWAMDLVGGHSVLIAMSPLIFMAIEALMSALAVSWRIGGLRGERDEARARQEEFRVAANTDPLTDLLNRRAFIDRACGSAPIAIQQRLILIDIDNFKLVNDDHGHQVGDDVLIRVAQVLLETAPATALVGRLGGEEFAVLVPTRVVDALPDRLCRAIAVAAMPTSRVVTISVGVADGPITDDADWRRIYHAADQALYRAKHGGRNRVSHAPRPLAA